VTVCGPADSVPSTIVHTSLPLASYTASLAALSREIAKPTVMEPRVGFGTVERMPKLKSSIPDGTETVLQSQAVAHSSISAGDPAQSKCRMGQQVVPTGTPAAAVIEMKPVQPGGMGFGAGDRSSLTSVAVKPGHSPVTLQGASTAQVVLFTWM
jgi:hypothetical protein